MIAQGFGFTRDFLMERNNSAYCRLKKISCEFKEQVRARHPGEKCGLARQEIDRVGHGNYSDIRFGKLELINLQ